MNNNETQSIEFEKDHYFQFDSSMLMNELQNQTKQKSLHNLHSLRCFVSWKRFKFKIHSFKGNDLNIYLTL